MTENATNIRNTETYKNSFWDWTPFNDCFLTAEGQHTGIRIGDIDGEVERNGHFLQIETKREGEDIPLGQMRRIKARVSKGDTVMILYGETNKPKKMEIFKPHQTWSQSYECDGSITLPRKFIKGWFLWADANGWMK